MENFNAHGKMSKEESQRQVAAWQKLCTHLLPQLIEQYVDQHPENPSTLIKVEMEDGRQIEVWYLFTFDDGTRLCLLEDKSFLLATGLHYMAAAHQLATIQLSQMSYGMLDLFFQFLLPRAASIGQYDKYYAFLGTLWSKPGMQARRAPIILPTH